MSAGHIALQAESDEHKVTLFCLVSDDVRCLAGSLSHFETASILRGMGPVTEYEIDASLAMCLIPSRWRTWYVFQRWV